jgi:hypothetical protein
MSNPIKLPIDPAQLVRRFDHPENRAIVVMGSHARGDAGPWSDVDLVRFTANPDLALPDNGSYVIDDILVVVSTVAPAEVQSWFERPELAVVKIAGARRGRALLDRDGFFGQIQARALAFEWDAAMQARANAWAGAQLVGWIEEVHKGLEGLRRNDAGRLLNARHGCSWGLSFVMQVQLGLLLDGDNTFYDGLAAAIGPADEWVRLRRIAFGVEDAAGAAPSLAEQVRAGLALYALTGERLAPVIAPHDRALVERTVARIRAALEPR